MDLQEVGCVYMDWIGLAQGRDRWRTLVSAVRAVAYAGILFGRRGDSTNSVQDRGETERGSEDGTP